MEVERVTGAADREGDGRLEQVSRWGGRSGQYDGFRYRGGNVFCLSNVFLLRGILVQRSDTRHSRYYLGR